jgi:hypothetical protein
VEESGVIADVSLVRRVAGRGAVLGISEIQGPVRRTLSVRIQYPPMYRHPAGTGLTRESAESAGNVSADSVDPLTPCETQAVPW